MYCTLLPAISFGSSAIVFFSGIPSDAAGPVADSVTPIFTCADAVAAAHEARGERGLHPSIHLHLRCLQTLLESLGSLGRLPVPKQVNKLTISPYRVYARFPVKHPIFNGTRTAPRADAPAGGRNGRSTVTRSGGVVWMKKAEKGGIVCAIDVCATIKERHVDPA